MVSDSAKEFLNGLKEKKGSEFLDYKDDIFYLKNNGVSIKDIYSFLVDKFEVKSSYQNLSQWIKRQDEYKNNLEDKSKNTTTSNTLKSQKESIGKIEKYPDSEGGLKKHNLHDQIVRPSFSFED